MTFEQPISDFFTAGGTLPPDAPSYVKRSTDDELFRHIMAGEFCYILTPRQMGKSSLMIRTSQQLSNEGVKSAVVDLTQIGTVDSEDQWYKGILTQIKRRLRLSIDPVTWWEQRKDIPNIQKFIEFFEEMLSEMKEHVVIFMDEIDTTLKLDFRDNFFAGIRAMFNARAENPDLKRITFVLLGVASPSDLIKDRNRTPFNIGQEILLRPFSREDARMLEKGLEEVYPKFGNKILDRIFYWTNGHPYLTQKLCQSVVEQHLDEYNDDEIDGLVERLFISEQASRETNLQFVRDNILNYPERRIILSLYKKLLRSIEVRDNKNSLHQNHLKLSGLARTEDGSLIVSNKIYSKVFDLRWVNKYTEVDWRYVIIGILGLAIITFVSVIYNDAIRLPNQSDPKIVCLAAYKDYRGIKCLADLFQTKPYIFPNVYEYNAKDTFFNTFSWEDQKSLIEITSYESHPQPEEYEIVVTGLYTSLADVDNLGDTTELLKVMYKSLEEMGLQDEVVYQEIGYWLEARKSASENNLEGALIKYTAAINLNPQNPATLFERARINTRIGNYENALRDYEQVVAIVPESDIEPTEVFTSIPSVYPTAAITGFTQSVLPTLSFATSIPATQLAISSIVAPSESTPNTIAVPSEATLSFELIATPTSIPDPIQSRFITQRQRITAVRTDIYQNGDLYLSYFQSGQVSLPNLSANIPALPPTPTPTQRPGSKLQYYTIVLDASEKMNEMFDGKSKWDIAREAVYSILNGLDPDANYGLIVVGGGISSDPDTNPCNEPSNVKVPFSSKQIISDQIDQLQPLGGGSLYNAFVLAKNQLDSLPQDTSKTLIFITNSSDSCDSADEWSQLETAFQFTDLFGFYSEIIVLDETGLTIQTLEDRIRNVTVSAVTATPTPYRLIYNGFVNCRSGPGVNFPVVMTIQGQVLTILAKDSFSPNWLFVAVEESQSCWLSNEILNLPPQTLETLLVICNRPLAPNLNGNQNGQNVNLSWSSVSGATSYEVFRSVNGGAFTSIGTTNKTNNTSMKDTISTNTTHVYFVVAINPCGESTDSNEVTISR